MIAKIARGTSVERMVLYNHNKAIGKDSKAPSAQLLGYNALPAGDYKSIVNTIIRQNLLNENVVRPNIHISLNFHKNDVLSNHKIFEVSKRYMEEMGYQEQPYAVFRHFDTDHPHVHIVSTQIDHFGKFINDSYLFRRSERVNRKLEVEFEITKAINQKSNRKYEDLNLCITDYIQTGKGPLVSTLRDVIDQVLRTRPISISEFDFRLKDYQVIRTSTTNGNGGHIFNIVEIDQLELDQPKHTHKSIAGHEIGSDYTLQALLKTIELNNTGKKKVKRSFQGKTYSVINEVISPITLSEFMLRLKKKGIDLIIKRKQTGDEVGSIYGFLFKDLKTGFQYSASELKIKTIDLLAKLIDDQHTLPDISAIADEKELSEPPLTKVFQNAESPVTMEIDFEGILSSFSAIFDSHVTYNEDNELLAKKKKKRKRRKK